MRLLLLPQRYKFSSKSQPPVADSPFCWVVVATAKVQIFKQITTPWASGKGHQALLLLPQRYKFSSKSQHGFVCFSYGESCCCYRKGTNFQANHNVYGNVPNVPQLLLLSQRYKFSSKSQLLVYDPDRTVRCCCYRKGTNFQANHNSY